jgi:hypothetical protein
MVGAGRWQQALLSQVSRIPHIVPGEDGAVTMRIALLLVGADFVPGTTGR